MDENEDYKGFRIEEMLESAIDPRRLGLIKELVVNPNTTSSS